MNHWVFFASSHTKILRLYFVYCQTLYWWLCKYRRRYLRKKSAEDSDEIFEDEARHIRKVVLCVLLEEWRAVLGNIAEDPRITLWRIETAVTRSSGIKAKRSILCVILESSASFTKSPIKRLAVHKVQPALALLVQLYKIRSNLLRICF